MDWKGENGKVYFYQSEFPYDVTQANYGDKGYVSYRVDPGVQNHQAWGVGVYSYFRDHDVTVESGISAPTGDGISFTNSLSIFLDGQGGIKHVVNETGNMVSRLTDKQAYVCGLSRLLGEEEGCCDWFWDLFSSPD